jgi:hypothetical protein
MSAPITAGRGVADQFHSINLEPCRAGSWQGHMHSVRELPANATLSAVAPPDAESADSRVKENWLVATDSLEN